ncbi:2-amino-4-hydroxy-6-hydroxymethyldihydropteridine diphosphokinase [Kineobactrum sediminis]|uniref:2-amino-4-hydroxy-6-hydroxymethyldihydropteridine pyrophosphokinase n=1 Tax=Kineobactrum sediminis TaxID=1905677 RepID=A0A2N5Y680_9GAMM|nr:2-amino-4-hydroxy-6-hydroxymethyldihydropteridine diphosphokinase [Kineobactrum sediminis]PLW83892.1 2-amino-4-hydroxy-6-hydroxymethyldihydropteridine diphosphokinase [Kineobactrum sediminis]
MPVAYIALGSNLGHPARQLQAAVNAMARLEKSRIIAGSSVYNSTAVGPGEQPDYLNAVLAMTTELGPEELLDTLQAIEKVQGRERTVRWGPRPIDLDILLFGDQAISTPRLQVPHPAMAQRHFVLYPLAEICDKHRLLPSGVTLGALLAACPKQGLERDQTVLDYHLQQRPEPGP